MVIVVELGFKKDPVIIFGRLLIESKKIGIIWEKYDWLLQNYCKTTK